MEIKKIAVIGSGTQWVTGSLIHFFSQLGYNVILIDVKQEFVDKGIDTISKKSDRQVKKGILTDEQKKTTLSNIKSSTKLGIQKIMIW